MAGRGRRGKVDCADVIRDRYIALFLPPISISSPSAAIWLRTRFAAAERVSLSITCKFPLCDSRIGDKVKKRGLSLGRVLSGAARVSKGKFSFLSGLEIQPNKRNDTLNCRR